MKKKLFITMLISFGFINIEVFSETITYDEQNRITSVDYGGGKTIAYSYDKVGNRETLVSTGVPEPSPYATNNVPVWWLSKHGVSGNPDVASLEDQDNDGVATWKEWAADTDPFDSENRFVVELDQDSADGVLAWVSSSKRTYTVWSTTDLLANPWVVVPGYENIVGTDALIQIDLTHEGETSKYYKVSVGVR